MKTIILLILSICVYHAAYSQTSSLKKALNYTPSSVAEDPYNPDWDWEKGDVLQDGVPRYWIYFQNKPNTGQEYSITLPWNQTGAWGGLTDRKKEDGWVLLTRNFGTPTRRISDLENPYFVLYNINRSIIRVFLYIRNMTDTYSYSTMELQNYSNGNNSGVFGHLASVCSAMDKVSDMYNNSTFSVINTLAMKERWIYSDFPLSFDNKLVPIENSQTPASLEFKLYGSIVNNINLETKGFGAQGEKKFVDAFMKKYNFDAPGFSLNSGNMPELNSPFSLESVDIKSTAANWDGLKGFIDGLRIDMENVNALNPFKGLLSGFGSSLSALSAASPLSIAGLDLGGLFKFFVGGGMKAANAPQAAPTFISSHYSSTGTMTLKVQYASLTIPLPAARKNYQSSMFGNEIGLVRNDPVGILTLIKTPLVYQKSYFKYYDPFYNEYGLQDWGELAGFTEYEIADDIQISLNQSSGLEIIETEVSLICDYQQLESRPQSSFNNFYCWIGLGYQNHLVEFEAPVNSTTAKFRSMAVPIKFAKGRTFQLPPGYINNICLKVKSVLKRKDDPNAQPVVFIATYKADVADSWNSPTEQNLPTIPPQNVKVTVPAFGGVMVSWDRNLEKNVNLYAIERSINGAPFVQIGTTKDTVFTDAEVQKAVKPYRSNRQNVSVNYRVKAKSEWLDENSNWQSQYSAYSDVSNISGSIIGVFAKSGTTQIIPESNSLSQNFPNPFNPSTTIYYGLKEAGNVTIKIYNALGQEIVTLVNERKESGYHYAEWNASGLPSGMYFYKIQSGNYTESKKMLLTK